MGGHTHPRGLESGQSTLSSDGCCGDQPTHARARARHLHQNAAFIKANQAIGAICPSARAQRPTGTGFKERHEATDTSLPNAPVSQAAGHSSRMSRCTANSAYSPCGPGQKYAQSALQLHLYPLALTHTADGGGGVLSENVGHRGVWVGSFVRVTGLVNQQVAEVVAVLHGRRRAMHLRWTQHSSQGAQAAPACEHLIRSPPHPLRSSLAPEHHFGAPQKGPAPTLGQVPGGETRRVGSRVMGMGRNQTLTRIGKGLAKDKKCLVMIDRNNCLQTLSAFMSCLGM